MITVIDGKKAILGRLASYVAKEALKGEEIAIINCEEIIITGNRKDIEKKFLERRQKGGSSQKGPIHHKDPIKMVKRTIRGMIPNYREGRGRVAFKNIKCYKGSPKELEKEKIIQLPVIKRNKFSLVKDIAK